MNTPENVRRGAEGAAGRSVLGADGRRDGQINGTEIPLKIPPPEFPREFTPEFGGGGGGKRPPPQLGPVLQTRKNARQNFRPYFFALRRTNEFGRGGGGKFGNGGGWSRLGAF